MIGTRLKSSSIRISSLLPVLCIVTLLLLAACRESGESSQSRGAGADAPPEPAGQQVEEATLAVPREEREVAVNRIAYIGTDGNVYTINPDGTDLRRLTDLDLRASTGAGVMAQLLDLNAYYTWPTWSPDGARLATARVEIEDFTADYSLVIIDVRSGSTSRIYNNEPNSARVAAAAPFYLYWSPKGVSLSFLASTPRSSRQTLTLFTNPFTETGNTPHLVGQAPIYYSWSADGQDMLIHWGNGMYKTSPLGDQPQELTILGFPADGFRAPALSRDGRMAIYASNKDGTNALYIANAERHLPEARALLDIGDLSSFLMSPTRDEVAVADGGSSGAPAFERLSLVTIDGTSKRTLIDEDLIAFFWSPDGEKLAYVAVDAARSTSQWKFVTRDGGQPVELASFSPSPDFLTFFAFFDQYAYSNTIWSPDSSRIVFSGRVGTRGPSGNGASARGDRLYVLEIKEGAVPREIATSQFGVWSWK